MVSVRRGADRFFALAVATSPLWNLLYRNGVDYGVALVVAVGSLGVASVLLLERGPSHGSSDVWRFGAYTFLGHLAFAVLLDWGANYVLADHPVVAVVAWVVLAAGALVVVAYRR